MRKSIVLSTISLFAALFFAVTEFLPGIPLYGLSSKSKIQVSIVLIPVYGVVLGPFLGSLSILLGVILATLYPRPASNLLSYMNIISPTLGTFVSGYTSIIFVENGNPRKVIKKLALVFSTLIIFWIILPVGRMILLYVTLHIISTITALLYVYFYENIRVLRTDVLRAFILSLVGIMTDHLVGSLNGLVFFTYIMGIKPKVLASIYISAIPLILIERITMIALGTLFTLSILKIPTTLFIRK